MLVLMELRRTAPGESNPPPDRESDARPIVKAKFLLAREGAENPIESRNRASEQERIEEKNRMTYS